MKNDNYNLPKILETGEVMDNGKIVDGRASATHMSKLIARCAQKLGRSSGLAKAIAGAQQASDNLKQKGFDPSAIDRVMWVFNEPFPLSPVTYVERMFTPHAKGIAEIDGIHGRIYSGSLLSDINRWRGMTFTEGRSVLGMWDLADHEGATGAGKLGISAAVALAAWRGECQRMLIKSGLDESESKQFVAGHELGHVIFHTSGHPEMLEKVMIAAGFCKRRSSGWGQIQKAAEELFADALGALAATPTDLERGIVAAGKMRARRSLFSTPDKIYIRSWAVRKSVALRLVNRQWSAKDGAADLVAESLAMAIAGLGHASIREATARVEAAFLGVARRPLAGTAASSNLSSEREPRRRPPRLPR